MENRTSELLRIVQEEVGVYRDLIEHSRRKTALLIQGLPGPIQESNRVDDSFNQKLRLLENEVARLTSDLSAAFGIPMEEFTLLRLADLVEASAAVEIRSLVRLFKNLVSQLKTVNQRNMRLIESSVRYSRGLLDLIANATTSYENSGFFRTLPSLNYTISRRA